ncbi:serine/threonine protein kinase [Apiospora sp. TS-2023a]
MRVEAEHDYQSAVREFVRIRDENKYQEAQSLGGRSFILVSALNEALLALNQSGQTTIATFLRSSYDRHGEQKQQNVDELKPYLPVFYVLLELDAGHLIHRFVERQVGKLPVLPHHLRSIFENQEAEDIPDRLYRCDLPDEFSKHQWRWCPLQFDWRMSQDLSSEHHIIPITTKTLVKSDLGVASQVERRSMLWSVEVPEQFVLKRLKKRVSSEETRGRHTHCRMVIKQFSSHDKPEFDEEKNLYNGIGEKNGIVKYYGWFANRAIDEEGDCRTYYSLVLEYGEEDLYSVFNNMNPPVTTTHIRLFWKRMADIAEGLAALQITPDQDDSRHVCYVWHGDIKPENILRVGGRLKLTDPGEAQMLPVRVGSLDPANKPTISGLGGTRTFGCVFSVAATYVALGKEGVKQYRELRKNAKRPYDEQHVPSDAFHDGTAVLTEVTDWHRYLRICLRMGDPYTSRILDLVDNEMLITPGDERINASAVNEEIMSIVADNNATLGPTEIPNSIEKFLSQISQEPAIGQDIPHVGPRSGRHMFEEGLLNSSWSLRFQRESQYSNFIGYDFPIATPDDKSAGNNHDHALQPEKSTVPQPVLHPDYEYAGADPFTIHQFETELKKRRTELVSLSFFGRKGLTLCGPRKSREDRLRNHFTNSDIIYLVDNASSMARYWNHARQVLDILVWCTLEYDDDGMELHFTNHDDNLQLKPKSKKKQKREHFTRRLDIAEPRLTDDVATDMSASLACILDRHLINYSSSSGMKRNLTVFILTDGLWERHRGNDTAVDDYITNFIQEIPDPGFDSGNRTGNSAEGKPRERPISVQFIRFGHYKDARDRLQRLDNDLKNREQLAGRACADMIDTEHAEGDVPKMLLGSFIEEFDNKIIQGPTSPDLPKPILAASPPQIPSPETSGLGSAYLRSHSSSVKGAANPHAHPQTCNDYYNFGSPAARRHYRRYTEASVIEFIDPLSKGALQQEMGDGFVAGIATSNAAQPRSSIPGSTSLAG